MTNHPNRGPKGPSSNPHPAEIRAAREEAGLTQSQAAALVHSSPRNWQQWKTRLAARTPAECTLGYGICSRIRAGLIPSDHDGKITGEDPCRP